MKRLMLLCIAALSLLLLWRPAAAQLQLPAGEGRLVADRVRYDVKRQIFTAEGNVRLTMGDLEIRAARLVLEQKPQVATARGTVMIRERDLTLTADAVRYEARPRLAHADGNVVLLQEGATVRAARIRFDLKAQTTQAAGDVTVIRGDVILAAPAVTYNTKTTEVAGEGGVRLTQGRSALSGRMLTGNLRETRAEMTGEVRLIRAAGPAPGAGDATVQALAQEETTITAARMRFRWDRNEAEAEGGVVVTQRDKTAKADRGRYAETAGRLELVGDVVVEQLSGEWLVRGGAVESPKDEETKKALASRTILTCDRLLILLRDRDMEAEGRVTVKQEGRVAAGERARYEDKEKRIVLSGNVLMHDEEGNRIRADRVVISLVDETFEALGHVETEFRVKRGK